jgi:hypothetical protein
VEARPFLCRISIDSGWRTVLHCHCIELDLWEGVCIENEWVKRKAIDGTTWL